VLFVHAASLICFLCGNTPAHFARALPLQTIIGPILFVAEHKDASLIGCRLLHAWLRNSLDIKQVYKMGSTYCSLDTLWFLCFRACRHCSPIHFWLIVIIIWFTLSIWLIKPFSVCSACRWDSLISFLFSIRISCIKNRSIGEVEVSTKLFSAKRSYKCLLLASPCPAVSKMIGAYLLLCLPMDVYWTNFFFWYTVCN
jgi:hypothetical protein